MGAPPPLHPISPAARRRGRQRARAPAGSAPPNFEAKKTMAEQDPNPAGNGADGAGTDPQVATLAQYIKDLSVESPSSPQVFQWQDQPALDVNFQLNVERASDDVHEVSL